MRFISVALLFVAYFGISWGPQAQAQILANIVMARHHASVGSGAMTWNPSNISAGVALSNGNLTATQTATSGAVLGGFATSACFGASKPYFTTTFPAIGTDNAVGFGIANPSWSPTSPGGIGGDANSVGYYPYGYVYTNNVHVTTAAPTYTAGQSIQMAIDETQSPPKLWVSVANGNWNNIAGAVPGDANGYALTGLVSTGGLFPAFGTFDQNDAITATFTAPTPPTGFQACDSGQSIAALSPSSCSIATGATGTCAAMTVTMSPTSPAFSGTLSVGTSGGGCTDTTAGNFAMSGSNLNMTNSATAAGPYTGCVEAIQAGTRNSPQWKTVAITVTSGNPTAGLMPSDRSANANWKMAGLQSLGGIPTRSNVCATVNPIGGGADDTVAIQNAVNSCGTCPTYASSNACVVSLGAGTFTLSTTNSININRGVVVRGAGAGVTILNRTNGAILNNYVGVGPYAIFNLGGSYSIGSPLNLSSDVAQGSYTISVSSTTGVSVGSLVNLDELGLGQPEPDCCFNNSTGQVWASPDYRYEWNAHNPPAPGSFDSACYDNSNFTNSGNCAAGGNHSDATAYSIRGGGVSEEYHLVTAVAAGPCPCTVTFDSPVMAPYRVANSAAIEVFAPANIVQFAGIENLTMQMGGNGNANFSMCVYCWAKGVESYHYFNPGIAFWQGAFRDQLSNYWAHNGAWPVNGGGGYSLALTNGASEILIDNGISMLADKVIVMRASGAGTVVAYNYMDDAYISANSGWVETGLNNSHLIGSHHALLEGNVAFNVDSDSTHGNTTNLTVFRNWLRGIRAPFTGEFDGIARDDTTGCCSPLRALASHPYTYWLSGIGNVLGVSGVTTTGNGWVYSDNGGCCGQTGSSSMLKLGVNDFNDVSGRKDDVANTIYPTDPRTLGTTGTYATANGCMSGPDPCTTIIDGNYDFVTNSIHWASNDSAHTLPNSFYLSAAPSYFAGYTWPPVNPIAGTVSSVPAYARWQACQPTPTAACLFPQGPPTITGVKLAGGTAGNYANGAASGTSTGAITVSMSDGSSYDGSLQPLTGTDAAKFTLSSTTLPSNLNTNGTTPTCPSTPATYNLNIIAAPGSGEGGGNFTQAVTVTCSPQPTISAVNLSNGLTFTTPANAGSTIDTLSATCSTGSCAGATFALSTSANAPGCASAANNGSFAISGSSLNIGGSTVNAGTDTIGIQVTLAGATNNLACYPFTLTGTGGGSGGTFTVVAHAAVANSASGGNGVTVSGVNAVGANLIIADVANTSPTRGSITDSSGNTWHWITSSVVYGGPPWNDQMAYCAPCTVSSSMSFTYSQSGSFPSMAILALNDSGGTPTLDQSNMAPQNATGVTSIQPGSVTPTIAGELLVTGLAQNTTSATNTINDSFIISDQTLAVSNASVGVSLAYILSGTTAAINPTWSLVGSDTPGAAIATFKP